MTAIAITRAGPLLTVQDSGRFGMLAHGISASGPMDRGAFDAAGALLERVGEGEFAVVPYGAGASFGWRLER